MLDKFGEECSLLRKLISEARDLGPPIIVKACDDVDGGFPDLLHKLLNAYQDFLHKLSYFGFFTAHEAAVKDATIEVFGLVELLQLFKSLHSLHGFIQPLPCRLNRVNQQVLSKCLHETLHFQAPQKQLPGSSFLLAGFQVLEAALIQLLPALF